MVHTTEEDFQHFLSYSGFSNDPPEIIEKMRKAFFAGCDKSELDKSE